MAWAGVCDLNNNNSCLIGTFAAIPNSTTTWNCVGQNGGYTATCGYTNGACGAIAGTCTSGTATGVSSVFSVASADESWTCKGSNGGTDASCTQNLCTAPTTPLTTPCPWANNDTSSVQTASCATGSLVWNTVSNTCQTPITKCTPSTQSAATACPTNQFGYIFTTTPYNCDPNNPNAPAIAGTPVINNYCLSVPPTCIAGQTQTIACGNNYNGTKLQTSLCPTGDYGTVTWSDTDVSACQPIATSCTPYNNTRTVACPSGQYGTGIVQENDFTCDNNGNQVASGWYNADTSGCNTCVDQSIPVGYAVTLSATNQISANQYAALCTTSFDGTTQCYTDAAGDYVITFDMWGGSIQNFIDGGYINCTATNSNNNDFLGYYIRWSNSTVCANSSQGTGAGYVANGGTASIVVKATTDQIITAFREWDSLMTYNLNTLVNYDINAVQQCPDSSFTLLEHDIYDPLKVNIKGGDAKVNGDRSIQFTMTQPDGSVSTITTYGSLNPDEAWVMIDRDGKGLVHNGIVNGDDFLTDHNGKKSNAFHDLITSFQPFVVKDENGNSYIPLHQLTAAAKQANGSDPSSAIKLLDVNNNVLFASDYFDRIYTDYVTVSEPDAAAHDIIKQRSLVRDIKGNTHKSADQWFAPQK